MFNPKSLKSVANGDMVNHIISSIEHCSPTVAPPTPSSLYLQKHLRTIHLPPCTLSHYFGWTELQAFLVGNLDNAMIEVVVSGGGATCKGRKGGLKRALGKSKPGFKIASCYLQLVCFHRSSQASVGVVEKWGRLEKLAEPGLNFFNPCAASMSPVFSPPGSSRLKSKSRPKPRLYFVICKKLEPGFIFLEYAWNNESFDMLNFCFAGQRVCSDNFFNSILIVRAQVPRMALDQLFEQKDEVAKTVLQELQKVMGEYGYNIEHILNPFVRRAMNEINAAQRLQLASVYKGEADKISQRRRLLHGVLKEASGAVYHPLNLYLTHPVLDRVFGFKELKETRTRSGVSCEGYSDREAELGLEREILMFMKNSSNPNEFPTKKQLSDAGRIDLVDAISKTGGWLALVWDYSDDENDFENYNFDHTTDLQTTPENFQQRQDPYDNFPDFLDTSHQSASPSGRSL
ncbi:hypothetical protein L2E82_30581 [Cichorium intybus]|uniref:Uncharacterized protein n=1 Tax=Cichorium intybus TaxID=13427 RepID=A0ACB9D0R9_CICIN|nr:hypothetical protein L2E82_30581 [Cichorium intybus]